MNEEEIIIQSNKDLIKIVGNDLDKETCLYLKQIAQDFMQLVEGDITIKVTDGSIDIQAEQAIDLQVNGNQILIEPHQIQINGDEIFLNTLSGMHGELVAVGNNLRLS